MGQVGVKMLQNIERMPLSGYKLFNLGSHWELHSSGGIYKGSFELVRAHALFKLGFEEEDIEIAVGEMHKNFHNGAEFGIYKRFIFTFERNFGAKTSIH